ncbi:MAG: GH1 family beta-glucosidase [Anaerocolumna sp.]
MAFQKDFAWGAASAAYQIEGGAFEDGKGASIWDTYSHDVKELTREDRRKGIKNAINNKDNGDTACNHYHTYKEDVRLMKKMGLKAYRFSISWARVLPDGTGKINEKGLRFYSDLVDELLENGIEPYITLFHWDLPQALYDRGGWLNRESPDWFAEYAKVVVDRLSDRVSYWMTLNEPQCHIVIGHIWGTAAPGYKATNTEGFYMMHHILMAHGKAVQTIRKYSRLPARIGYAPCGAAAYPASDSKEDIEAARQYVFSCRQPSHFDAGWWFDTVLSGKYPEDGIAAFAGDFPKEMIREGDMETMCQPLDFLGINVYQGPEIRYDEKEGFAVVPNKVGYDKTAFKWAVTPKVLYYVPKFLYERYKLPVIITENGLSNADWVSLDQEVHDPQRIDFMHRYLKELKRAAEDGIDIQGYFAWSVMDNMEWNNGYDERFGLIHVDFGTLRRTLKDSAYWYAKVIEMNGENL